MPTISNPLPTSEVLGGSSTAVTLTGSTSETTMATLALPAGKIPTHAQLRIYTLWSFTGSVNAKTKRIKLGSTAFMDVATTGGTSVILGRDTMIFARSRTAQVAMAKTAPTGLGAQTSAVTTGTENLDTALDLTITGQLASAGESLVLEAWKAVLYR